MRHISFALIKILYKQFLFFRQKCMTIQHALFFMSLKSKPLTLEGV